MTDTNAMREAVAKIIEPYGWSGAPNTLNYRDSALFKANTILALLATDRAAGVGEVKLDLAGLSKCNKCGRYYPSAPPGVVHKCGQCRGGMCSPVEPAASSPVPADASGEVGLVGRVKDILRGPEGDDYTDAGMEDAFFRWPIIERALRAALSTAGAK